MTMTMADLPEMRERWEQSLATYGTAKTETESKIRSIRESAHAERGPAPEGFLAKVASRLGQGVESLKAFKRIHDVERQLSAVKDGVRAQATQIRGQLTGIALSLDANAAASAELAQLPKSTKAFTELRGAVSETIRDLEKGAAAQDAAYSIKDSGATWQAKDSADQAGRSLDRLVGKLRSAPPGIGSGTWGQIGLGEFNSLGLNTFSFNLSGQGQWLNAEMAKTMRRAIEKLRALDGAISKALKSITARGAALHQEVLVATGASNAEFLHMYEAVKEWL